MSLIASFSEVDMVISDVSLLPELQDRIDRLDANCFWFERPRKKPGTLHFIKKTAMAKALRSFHQKRSLE